MIKLLDMSTINKIAAGEVIERPFSVVKELVENSIDAGSTKIIVEIKEGGISFIRVTDNGCGIPSDELETAFLSHATSKITSISDLNTLYSLGFRGEALASIAAVSQLEIMSKTNYENVGSLLEVFGGEVINKKEAACNNGTSITVRNVFYNTPARKKFLKSTSAETGFISDFINKIALSRPDISLRFLNNGEEMLFTSGNGDLKTAVFCVYGNEYTENLIKVEYKYSDINIFGFIGKPDASRANRLYEDIFINGRFVKDRIISRAAEDAYKTYLPSGRFPAFVLNISMNPVDVDVNAHPQKLEVRFSNEQTIYDSVFSAVSDALSSISLIPLAKWKNDENQPIFQTVSASEVENTSYRNSVAEHFLPARENDIIVLDKPIDISFSHATLEKEVFDTIKSTKSEQTEILKEQLFSDYKIIGQVFQTYWIVEESGSLYLIDQHAAHERILFEKTRERLIGGNFISQHLVIPEKLELSEREKCIVIENIEYFEELGFQIEQVKNELYIINLPMIISSPENSQTIKQIIDIISEDFARDPAEGLYNIKINTLATIACKSAVKGNDRLTEREAKEIIKELLSLNNPFTCPHGRPTIVKLTRYELERMFKRT